MAIKIGDTFGKLTVLEQDKTKPKGRRYWICQCECGKTISSRTDSLSSGTTKSCGCLRKQLAKEKAKSRVKDETGNTYGKLTVIELDKTKKGAYWICKCECGKTTSVKGTVLRAGQTKSCGCLHIETITGSRSDLVGQKFGRLTVLKPDPKDAGKWICQCDCGNTTSSRTYGLLNGIKSCGCLNSKGEYEIAKILTDNNIPFKKEYTFEDLKSRRFDFAILDSDNKVIRLIEFDGVQHFDANNHFYTKEGVERDIEKNKYALSHNIPLVRIPYWKQETLSLQLIQGNEFLVRE